MREKSNYYNLEIKRESCGKSELPSGKNMFLMHHIPTLGEQVR